MSGFVPSHGIVLFAHGSRDPLWHKPIEAVSARIAALAPTHLLRAPTWN